ncbi:MAG: hypothetical protein PHX08_02000 [Lachnospiraceae bacterium]|nr:hypothetical protein [Lachnospiraceae bacterium]
MNTCEVEISDIEDDVNIEFPEGTKVISYEITDVEGIKNLKKGMFLVDKIDNKIALSVVKDDNKEMQSLSIRFNITASPEYRGDVYVNLEDNDVKTIVAKVNSPININAESTEGRTDHRENSVADIVISENFIGAMTKNSELMDYWNKEIKDNFALMHSEIYKNNNEILLCVQADYYDELKRQRNREVIFSDLSKRKLISFIQMINTLTPSRVLMKGDVYEQEDKK